MHVDHTIRHLSICSGYGGIDIGLRTVLPTCRTIAYVEIEAYACANLVAKMEAKLLDAAPIWTNLRTFDARPLRGHVDIVSGGFPCQPYSACGARKADADPRHLFPDIERVVTECKPACIFLENVEGIITAKLAGAAKTSVLKHVLGRLESCGYRATWGLYSAAEIGAPHKRNRVFILALADTDSRGSRKDQQPSEQWAGRTQQPPINSGEMQTHALEQITMWPAGPEQKQHHYEKPRATEPSVGGAAHGIATRLDRLRLLGNGVVPQQAARAFSDLYQRMHADCQRA